MKHSCTLLQCQRVLSLYIVCMIFCHHYLEFPADLNIFYLANYPTLLNLKIKQTEMISNHLYKVQTRCYLTNLTRIFKLKNSY